MKVYLPVFCKAIHVYITQKLIHFRYSVHFL